jgi:hypothetical protein
LEERQEHGKQVVSSEELYWVRVAKQGTLEKLRDVLDHWKWTGKRRSGDQRVVLLNVPWRSFARLLKLPGSLCVIRNQ